MPRTVRIENAQRCPLCREPVFPAHARRLIACSACETVYHRSCFGEMGGCAVLGCQRFRDPERSTLRTAGERGAKPLATKDPAKQVRPKQARETDKPGPPAPLRVQRITLLAWMLLLWLFGIAATWASLVPTLVSVAYLAWRPLHVRRIALVVPAVLILLGLLALPMGPRSLFSFWPAWLTLASVVYAAWRRSGTALVVFGLAPAVVIFGLNFSWGVVDYAQGTAVYHGFGRPSRGYGNLLPELRCYRQSNGCIRNGRTFFTHEAYNIAVTRMIGLFGPMAGSYIGPYPTRATAYRVLSEATFVISGDKVDALWRREVLIDGATVLPEQLPNLELWRGSPVPVRLRVVEGQCLLIGDPDSEIWLIDLESGKRFATYCDLGERIESLRVDLQLLAMSAEEQIDKLLPADGSFRRFSRSWPGGFHDDAPFLPKAARDRVENVLAAYMKTIDEEGSSVDALRTSSKWREVRRLARLALEAF